MTSIWCGVLPTHNTTRKLTATPPSGFAAFLRERRAELASADPRSYSLRQVAYRVGIEPSYLSKVERGLEPPPGEKTAIALARELQLDPDLLLAMAGKVSSELQTIIRKRPKLFADLIRALKDQPDHAVLRIVREVRDGNW
ncbi:MAG TPA: helix-turn-helix transcriptional regulator [Chthoniobacterales bacterium]|nr:helix-turn-helix transcriptional regulator [Chthoniobacterales bacterium]